MKIPIVTIPLSIDLITSFIKLIRHVGAKRPLQPRKGYKCRL